MIPRKQQILIARKFSQFSHTNGKYLWEFSPWRGVAKGKCKGVRSPHAWRKLIVDTNVSKVAQNPGSTVTSTRQ